jgi:transcriptional regulator with XRE-family HTH domain
MPKTKHFIREWRQFRGYTQERLANLVDMSVSSISQLERGQQGYTEESLAKLAEALGCEPADLLSRDPNKPADYLWRIVNGMGPTDQAQAIRLIKALTDAA